MVQHREQMKKAELVLLVRRRPVSLPGPKLPDGVFSVSLSSRKQICGRPVKFSNTSSFLSV